MASEATSMNWVIILVGALMILGAAASVYLGFRKEAALVAAGGCSLLFLTGVLGTTVFVLMFEIAIGIGMLLLLVAFGFFLYRIVKQQSVESEDNAALNLLFKNLSPDIQKDVDLILGTGWSEWFQKHIPPAK